jgi:transposase
VPTLIRQVPKKERPQDLGRSRAGLTKKIHAAVDGLGNPVRLLLTGGEAVDITQAHALIDGFEALAIVADQGYDADAFVISITSRKAEGSFPAGKTALLSENTITMSTKAATWLSGFSITSSSSGAWLGAMRNSRGDFMVMLHLVFAFIWLQ